MGGNALPPLSLLIKPASDLCNARCGYCFYTDVSSHRDTKSRGLMQPEVLEALVRRALAEAEGFCSFTFQGGEPTLAGLDFFRRLPELEQKYNVRGLPIRHAIQTNGLTLDEEWARFLRENHFLAGLSIDGTRELHDALRPDAEGNGTYARAVRAAALLERHQVEYNVLCVVNNAVARHPQRVYAALRKYRYLQFIPCLDGLDGQRMPWSLEPERYGEFLKGVFDGYYADFFSGAPVSVRGFDNYVGMLLGRPPESCGMSGVCACGFVTEADGSVYPCDFYALDEYRLGDVRTDSFEALRNAAEPFLRPSRLIHGDCRRCEWFPLCRGGCRRERETAPDGSAGKNRLCAAYRSFFAYAYPRMQRLAAAVRLRRG